MNTKPQAATFTTGVHDILLAMAKHGLVLSKRQSRHGGGLVDYRLSMPIDSTSMHAFFFRLAKVKLRNADVFSTVVNETYLLVPAVWEPSNGRG